MIVTATSMSGGSAERSTSLGPAAGALGPAVDEARTIERGRLNLSWLVQLHWWAILGQFVAVIASVILGDVVLPIPSILTLLALEGIANGLLAIWSRRARITDLTIALVMLGDAVVLTILLDLTGGASNPFSTLYLVNVALAAVLLPRFWAWTLTAASLGGFGSLFIHEALTSAAHHVRFRMSPEAMLQAHLRGMWIAFAMASVFVVFFVRRVVRALSAREAELQEARALALRRERLASLATLAAGTAHELATPLSTIAVVVRELERGLLPKASDDVRRDLGLVRDQVNRCRAILDRMSGHAGAPVGEPLERIALPAWGAGALDGLPAADRVTVEIAPGAEREAVRGPPRALGDALRGLLKNALQASGPGFQVQLRLSAGGGRVVAAVLDRGQGMTAEVRAHVGEPFFTTKVPGEGMGLGLFLTRTLVEQLGGDLRIVARSGGGTEARIDLPAAGAGENGSSA